MDNKEYYEKLNIDYKKYLDRAFTYIDFIEEGPSLRDNLELGLILSYLVLNNCYMFNETETEMIMDDFSSIPIKSAYECYSFYEYNIDTKLFDKYDTPSKLFNEYLINTLEFSKMCEGYDKDKIIDIVNSRKELINKYNLDEDKNFIYEYDNYTIVSNKYKNEVYLIDNNKEEITKIISINNLSVSNELIESLCNQSAYNYKLNIVGIKNNKEISFQVNSDCIFYKEKNEEEKEIYTPNIDKYGFDMTEYEYLTDPAVGREDEIRRIEQVLLYPEKDKSIIIVGDAGIGKTSLVRGLAYRIKTGNVPKQLKNLKIISIDVSTMVAGTKYVGTLEEKLKNILDEASQSKNIIIFIDEIHQAISGGISENDSNSVAEILKPYIDFGRVRIIGCTTNEEYEREIEKNQAFKTRLKKIKVDEPENYVIYDILNNLIDKYNEISYSKLDCSIEERNFYINMLIELTSKKHRNYFDKESNPRLVLDILKEAYAIANINERENINKSDFIEAISNEERLGKSAKESIIYKLENSEFSQNECRIIKFRKNR